MTVDGDQDRDGTRRDSLVRPLDALVRSGLCSTPAEVLVKTGAMVSMLDQEAILATPPLMAMSERLLARPRVLLAFLLLALTGGAGLAWSMLQETPLMTDDFDDRWFDSRIWQAPVKLDNLMGVREGAGYLRLLNRGCVVTRAEFRDPYAVEFDWNWIDLASDPLYADHLAVALRTSGVRKTVRSFEMRDGVIVRFNTWGGDVTVESGGVAIARTATGAVPMPADTWFRIRITDDGETIQVFAGESANWSNHSTTPILTARCPDNPAGHSVAVYNREVVAGALHESRIDTFTIRRYSPEVR